MTQIKPTMYMLVGLPGSGKSSLAKKLSCKQAGGLAPLVCSSDAIRAELFGDVNDQVHNEQVFRVLHERIRDGLKSGRDVVYDATNISSRGRKQFLSNIEGIAAQKVCLAVMTPYSVCLQQNSRRERKVPEYVIERMCRRWEKPSAKEGFDKVVMIKRKDITYPTGQAKATDCAYARAICSL